MTRRPVVALFVAALTLLAVTVAPDASASARSRATSASSQFDWLLDALAALPVSERDLRQHVSARALQQAGGSEGLNASLRPLAGGELDFVSRTTATSVTAAVTTPSQSVTLSIAVDDAGLIDTVQYQPRLPEPATWREAASRLKSLAPDASLSVDEVDGRGRCHSVFGVDADVQRPLGSAFKLYVLGALADAVSAGRMRWSDKLALRDDWKSLPAGILQTKPAGTELTLAQYADYMISISDNTAADHLLRHLGRSSVAAELARLGNRRPASSLPLLTTREFFTLKGYRYPATARLYERLPRALRAALLRRLDSVPLSKITAWTTPRATDSIEWFGSGNDMCRALAGLYERSRHTGGAPIADAMTINDGGLALDPAEYPVTWFKGGSEPGVLTLNWLVGSASGRTFTVSVQLRDKDAALDEASSIVRAFAIVRGSLALAR